MGLIGVFVTSARYVLVGGVVLFYLVKRRWLLKKV